MIMDEEEELICWKDLALEHFKPLNEEDQKAIVFIIADSMDFYSKKMDAILGKRMKKEDRIALEKAEREFAIYQMLFEGFMELNEFMRVIGRTEPFIIEHGRKGLQQYLKFKDGRSA